MHVLSRIGVVLLFCITVTACADGGDKEPAAAVSSTFYMAIQSSQFQQACDLMAELTREKLVKSEGTECAQALAGLGLSAGEVTDTEVFGRKALVKLNGDNAFLAQQKGGWKIVAAGCEEQQGKPYDCKLEAG